MNRLPPPPGAVDLGDLARLTPVSDVFGFDRGNPVDRHYIEAFLAVNAAAIRGRTLEIGDATYTQRFGGRRVATSDVLHVREGNAAATIVADLTHADQIPSDTFDCIILTQTLQMIFDPCAAVRTLQRILRPGGVLLATVPGISQVSRSDWGDTWFWSFTELSTRQIFGGAFGSEQIRVGSHGNVLAATAFLQGLASRELSFDELEYSDAAYPVVITVRAEKRAAGDVPVARSVHRLPAPVTPPRISIIMVYGNAESFIAESIESVTRQTSPDWELLLIENGSGDCSSTVAARYEREYDGRIRCLRNDALQGEPADRVWRWALNQARGEYVVRLDPDHVWSPDVVAGLTAALDASPRAVAARIAAAPWRSWFEPESDDDVTPHTQVINDAQAGPEHVCGSALAVRRVELLRSADRGGQRRDALSILDPRGAGETGAVLAPAGRVECRIHDAMSGCTGLSVAGQRPVLDLGLRDHADDALTADDVPISLIICTRDRPGHIAACIEAALAQTHPAGEIIVVENAPSSDESARIIRRYPVRHRVESKPGLSHARNLGVASARFDVIAFTDDDARPDPEWLHTIAQAFTDPHVMAVTGLVLPALLDTRAQSLFEYACGGMGKGARPAVFAGNAMSATARMAAERLGVGANMSFRRSVFERVGPFDTTLGVGSPGRAAEDLDMFHRVVAAGMTLRYEPAAMVRHHHRTDMDGLARQLDDAAHGYATYLDKLSAGRTVSRTSAALFRARWYAWLVARVILGTFGLKDVPSQLLRSQLRAAWAVRQGSRGERNMFRTTEADRSAPAGAQ